MTNSESQENLTFELQQAVAALDEAEKAVSVALAARKAASLALEAVSVRVRARFDARVQVKPSV